MSIAQNIRKNKNRKQVRRGSAHPQKRDTRRGVSNSPKVNQQKNKQLNLIVYSMKRTILCIRTNKKKETNEYILIFFCSLWVPCTNTADIHITIIRYLIITVYVCYILVVSHQLSTNIFIYFYILWRVT